MGLMVREGHTYNFTDEIHLLTQPLNVSYKVTESIQGHPTSIFGKYLFGRRFEI